MLTILLEGGHLALDRLTCLDHDKGDIGCLEERPDQVIDVLVCVGLLGTGIGKDSLVDLELPIRC